MSDLIQQYVSVIAALALILQAIFLVEGTRHWGTVRGLSDLPAGLMLGVVAVAQMFHPLEPFEGVIIDLRLIPLVLAGAFLSLPATVLALALATSMRLGVGGVGMPAGTAAIALAGVVGQLWQRYSDTLPLSRLGALLVLGQAACVTIGTALLLPEPVRGWFFSIAAPYLALAYASLIPALAYILDARIGFESGAMRTRREALVAGGVKTLSVPAFLRRLRLMEIDDPDNAPVALMAVRPVLGGASLGARAMRDVSETVVTRLHRAFPNIELAAIRPDHTVLVPMLREQLDQLADTALKVERAVGDKPMKIEMVGVRRPTAQFGVIELASCGGADLGQFVHVPAASGRGGVAGAGASDLLFAKARIKLGQG